MCNLIYIFVIIFVIYAMYRFYKYLVFKQLEKFTSLTEIQMPLATYDDYGTFNFLLQTNDFPYYDPTYQNLTNNFTNIDSKTDINPLNKCETKNESEFINYDGKNKLRRKLKPSNYTDYNFVSDADFKNVHLLVKKDRPKQSFQPPQPHNVFYD